ncbi:MAG: caspase family protein [Sphingomonadaceae bacterium]|nr:caspase family protein [Sphingomonadaceae bacterium]
MGRVHALIAAINAYPPNPRVPQLTGCLADAENVAAYLKDRVGPSLALEMLTDAEAARPAIMEQFRTLLGRAGPGDVALFHYSGHGVPAGTAPDFADYFPAAMDESLLCYDSYADGGLVLADKELAVLVEHVAASGAEVCVTLDCCHSGSGTRDIGDEDALVRSAATTRRRTVRCCG